ncbi:hypothetical protein [Methylobacterium sp. Leaf99]|uniref:hypothetical protein n=1 Tax=Methylobacterium sp. Leaf99 TaxID=1736251 RepID=UPI000A7B3DB0|nr:hypothetical protein [Methylobacterium sp. Leaf99]
MSLNANSTLTDAAGRHRHRPHAGHRLGWAAVELESVKRALSGRQFLMFADIVEVRERIADAQAEIAKASASQTAGVQS